MKKTFKVEMPSFVATYSINDLNKEELLYAKEYVRDLLDTLLQARFHDAIDEMFDQLKEKRFSKDDIFKFNYSTEVNAGVMLAAITKATNKRSKKNG